MKEVRPSTWIMLGILVLVIFAPLFFMDMEQETPTANAAPSGPDRGIRPSNPLANDAKPSRPANDQPAANREPQPPANEPADGTVE